MNTPGLFILGAIVTLIVMGALALLIYGAVLDGRDMREAETDDEVRLTSPDSDPVPAR